jgi:hypothetical protein
MKKNKAFTLTNGRKVFFPHLKFLLSYHRYKKNKKDFLKGKTERDDAPSILLGEVLYDVLS